MPAVAMPPVVTWEIRELKSGKPRTFEQVELSIDGEVRLVQLASKTIQILSEKGFPWDEIGKVIDANGDIDWNKGQALLTQVMVEVPDFIADSTCIFLGLFPTDENGERNLSYDDDRAFIRKNIKFPVWIDLCKTFMDQNDYQRLAKPFTLAATRALEVGQEIMKARGVNVPLSQLPTSLQTQATGGQDTSTGQ